jgi:hypothetical protein
MRKKILVLSLAAAALLPASAAVATVNCNAVNRELRLGKWPADVALDLDVTLAEVQSCKNSPAKAVREATPPKRGASPKSVAAPKKVDK